MSKTRILLVEDDDIIAKVTDWRLKNLGYELCGRAVNAAEPSLYIFGGNAVYFSFDFFERDVAAEQKFVSGEPVHARIVALCVNVHIALNVFLGRTKFGLGNRLLGK